MFNAFAFTEGELNPGELGQCSLTKVKPYKLTNLGNAKYVRNILCTLCATHTS